MEGFDKRCLVKIATYYYIDGLTQQEIAQRMHMSRQRVSRMLKKAQELGIVRIDIARVSEYCTEVETELERRFGLKEAVVFNRGETEDLLAALGRESAKFVLGVVKDGDVIGVTWGRALASLADHLEGVPPREVSVVQLVGGVNTKNVSIKMDEITRRIAQNLGGIPYLLYAPAVVDSEAVKESFMSDNSIQSVLEMARRCRLALVGIGSMDAESTLAREQFLSGEKLEALSRYGSVGDVCLEFFDIQGRPLNKESGLNVVGIDRSTLKEIDVVVGIAAGPEKTRAILGALRGGYLDVLITDSGTAGEVLKLDRA